MQLAQPLLVILSSVPVTALNLSAPESFFLGSRLTSIQDSIRTSSLGNLPPTRDSDVAIIFPGAGGIDELTQELEARLRQETWATTVDWKEYRGSILTAAFDAEAVGETVAENTSWIQQRSVHIIGISVGGFAANAMAASLYNKHGGPTVRLTLLDPFCSRGVFGAGYGARHFGMSADYAEHFVNTDDPVPSTNEALPNCYCVDVTNAPERASFQLPEGESMHCWPVAFYARYGYQVTKQRDGSIVIPQHDNEHKRGMVLTLR